ncbi:hypothetical protein A2V80_00870 [Candidatus Woesebacteria bacterium RBG_16_39_8b]|uniref:Transglycosylase SLT domain-containing protein n=1 Tax=Candidatus Woesebacteria bacterium RBG_16_39_8b TaxID=1802482 RepID=A0A1F7XBY6_9BACT|nr:MAG: hypothetical protein A2V80_00870 [Candidatus Woesebacteria bacterium RBG_16_39_8b]
MESGGNPLALSEDNCRGLMQISEIVFNEWKRKELSAGQKCNYTFEDVYRWTLNKIIGERYLRRLRYHYNCYTLEQILAAYNGGITRLRKCNYDISKMPRETRDYVRKVMKLYREAK